MIRLGTRVRIKEGAYGILDEPHWGQGKFGVVTRYSGIGEYRVRFEREDVPPHYSSSQWFWGHDLVPVGHLQEGDTVRVVSCEGLGHDWTDQPGIVECIIEPLARLEREGFKTYSHRVRFADGSDDWFARDELEFSPLTLV